MPRFFRSHFFVGAALVVASGHALADEAARSAPAAPPAPAAPAAVAPVDDPVRAKALSDEAVELANNGDFPAACAKLEQSLAAHHGLGTEFHLAGCWAKIGRTASAYALFEEVATQAHELGQNEREDLARQRMDALVPKLSRIRVDVVSPAPHIEVRRDDVLVPESAWGQPLPVDRGSHEIRVTADGKAPWSTKVDVTDPATIIAVQVPALTDAPKEAPPPPVVPVTPAPAPAPLKLQPLPAPPETPADGGTERTLAIIVGSVGVAALAGGIVEGAQYLDSNREAKGICPSGVNCTEDEISRHGKAVDEARNERTWSYVGVGLGSVAVVGAAYLFFTAPHPPPGDRQRATAIGVAPWADGRGTWGGALHGSF
ncbi:MAG TPA: hypothetical protein VMI54_09250 [Polyangiaceae bacterium]|nr:hypothetical protein [Polyangiaceae bacterium]